MKRYINLPAVIAIFGVATVAGLIAVVATSLYALNEIKVNGPLYDSIKLGNDLIADILPPPEYVIEAYLEVTLAMRDPSSVDMRRDRLTQLHKDYDERREYWSKSNLEPSLKKALTEKSDGDVKGFWSLADNLLPALKRGDAKEAEKIYQDITSKYTSHRATIDQIVKEANEENGALEKLAAELVQKFSLMVWSVGIAILLLVTCGLIGIVIGVVRPLFRMTGVMRRLADGDMDIEIPSNRRHDEVGQMARAVEVFKDNSIAAKAMEERRIVTERQAAEEMRLALVEMASTVEAALGRAVVDISAQTSTMVGNAGQMAQAAQSVGANSTSVASAAEESLANAQTVSAASEQLSSSIAEISQQIHSTTSQTGEVVQSVDRARRAMEMLTKCAAQIGDFTSLINEIASRTNLLALNATIEAARAGDAGRGFAVVASEVKSLASQTAKATGDIATQITEIQNAAEESVGAVDEIGQRIGNLESSTSIIAAAIEEQSATTQEIAKTVKETTIAAREVAERIAEVSAEASQSGSSAVLVRDNCADIAALVEQLRERLVTLIRESTRAAA